MEAQIYDWSSNAAGNPVLAESPTAIASPPAIWVPPHSSYSLRVRLAPSGPGQERAYRVIVRQLPERSDIAAGRITLALGQSLPAFVEPTDITLPSVTARIIGPQQLMLANAGGRRLQIANVSQDGRVVAKGLAGYVLGRSNLAVRTSALVHPGQIEAETDLGPRNFELR